MGVQSREIINTNIQNMNRADFDKLEELHYKSEFTDQDKTDLITLYNRYVNAGYRLNGCQSCGGTDKLRTLKNGLYAWFNAHRQRFILKFEAEMEAKNNSLQISGNTVS